MSELQKVSYVFVPSSYFTWGLTQTHTANEYGHRIHRPPPAYQHPPTHVQAIPNPSDAISVVRPVLGYSVLGFRANAATVATSERKTRGPKETAWKSAAANLGESEKKRWE